MQNILDLDRNAASTNTGPAYLATAEDYATEYFFYFGCLSIN